MGAALLLAVALIDPVCESDGVAETLDVTLAVSVAPTSDVCGSIATNSSARSGSISGLPRFTRMRPLRILRLRARELPRGEELEKVE